MSKTRNKQETTMRSKVYSEDILQICTHKHLGADKIFQILKKKNPSIGQATVYRTLKSLVKGGLLTKIAGVSDNAYYELTLKDHAHLVDEVNGKIYDIELPKNILKSIKLPEKFDIHRLDIKIYGSYKK